MESISELKIICQDRGEDSGWYFNRLFPISIRITRILLHTPVTADQITAFFMLIGLFSCLLFGFGNIYLNLIGILLWHVMNVFDCVDGEIARYRKVSSLTARHWDYMIHFIVQPLMFMGMSFGAYKFYGQIYYLFWGFLAAIFVSVFDLVDWYGPYIVYGKMHTVVKVPDNKKRETRQPLHHERKKRVISRLFYMTKYFFHHPNTAAFLTLLCFMDLMINYYFQISLLYYSIILFGIAYPLLSLFILILQIINKSIDAQYRDLINI